MPAPIIKKLARQFKASRNTVERYWQECKEGINPEHTDKGYGLVVECVKKKLRKRNKS